MLCIVEEHKVPVGSVLSCPEAKNRGHQEALQVRPAETDEAKQTMKYFYLSLMAYHRLSLSFSIAGKMSTRTYGYTMLNCL